MTSGSLQKFFLILLFCVLLLPASSADARRRTQDSDVKRDNTVVVELFTASDCSACTYAGRTLFESMKDKKVIALTCHIKNMEDMSDPESKDVENKALNGGDGKAQGPMDPCIFRESAYTAGSLRGDVTLSIPAFVFNGYDLLGGSDPYQYEAILKDYRYGTKNPILEVMMQWKDAETISVSLPQGNKNPEDKISASVWLIRYKDFVIEKMESGVNKGRVLRFGNVIQDVKHIGKWHGKLRAIDVTVPKPEGGKEGGGYVVLVSELMGSETLAAGKLVDYPVLSALPKTP